MRNVRWTREQLKLAFHLYCQLPFGKLHHRNPEIIELAELIGRTPSAVAMKLVNFASLDPSITGNGRKGLGNTSIQDQEVWQEFNADWEGLAVECQKLKETLLRSIGSTSESIDPTEDAAEADYSGETKRVMVEQRIKQSFFRRAVLSSYRGQCCISGLSEPRLLMASHIIPWSKDKANRLNPRNGLCLSALHDKAFDRRLISLTDDFRIIVSDELKKLNQPFLNETIVSAEGKTITLPEKFIPSIEFISSHRNSFIAQHRLAKNIEFDKTAIN